MKTTAKQSKPAWTRAGELLMSEDTRVGGQRTAGRSESDFRFAGRACVSNTLELPRQMGVYILDALDQPSTLTTSAPSTKAATSGTK